MKSFADLLGRQLETGAGKADTRANLVKAVRAASRRLGLADDDRHALQEQLVGKASLSDMTPGEIGRVLDHLNRDRPAPMAHRAHVAKIKALWWSLYWLGIVEKPNEAALDAFVKRQTGLSSLRFVDHRKAPSLIEAMKAMAAREGVLWMSDTAIAAKAQQLGQPVDHARADRAAVLVTIWDRLVALRVMSNASYVPYARQLLRAADGDVWSWSAHEVDAVIRELGKRLRRALDKRERA